MYFKIDKDKKPLSKLTVSEQVTNLDLHENVAYKIPEGYVVIDVDNHNNDPRRVNAVKNIIEQLTKTQDP